MATISTVKGRDALKARRDPYFTKLGSGHYLGFRKITPTSVGTWVARYREEGTAKQSTRSLGEFGKLPPNERFDAAKQAAEEWFGQLDLGVTAAAVVLTVKEACESYVTHQRARKGDVAANDIEARFQRWIYADARLASVELAKLRRTHLDAWRLRLATTKARVNRSKTAAPVTRPRSPSSVNRDMASLRAALNFAYERGEVATDLAWRQALKRAENADGRRHVYLDKEQRRRVIDSAVPDISQFLMGLSLLPLRPGALAKLQVKHFDARLGVIVIGKDKTGKARSLTLPPSTVQFFQGQLNDKMPTAPLLSQADGSAWNKDDWKKPIKAAVVAAGAPAEATAYTLRHSTITDLVVGGLDLLTVARLSDTSVEMIERHYGHLQQAHAMNALATLAL